MLLAAAAAAVLFSAAHHLYGEPVRPYVFIFRIRDGRIAEVWENLDTLYLHTKLHV